MSDPFPTRPAAVEGIAAALDRSERFIAECEGRVESIRQAIDDLGHQGVDIGELHDALDQVRALLQSMRDRRDALLRLLAVAQGRRFPADGTGAMRAAAPRLLQ